MFIEGSLYRLVRSWVIKPIMNKNPRVRGWLGTFFIVVEEGIDMEVYAMTAESDLKLWHEYAGAKYTVG